MMPARGASPRPRPCPAEPALTYSPFNGFHTTSPRCTLAVTGLLLDPRCARTPGACFGEFSFIVGQAGVRLGVLTQDQYSLILAGALLSIMLNPPLFKAIPLAERLLKRMPRLWARLDRHPPAPASQSLPREGHVTSVSSPVEHQMLVQLLHSARGMHIAWRGVPAESSLVGRSLAEANLRARTGTSVIALIRGQQMLANPKSSTMFQVEDLVGLIGEVEGVAAAEQVITGESPGALAGAGRPAPVTRPGEAGAAL